MQSSLEENRDESGQLEEMAGSPSVSWGSTNFDDFSETGRIFPRIGDKYQVYIPPYNPQVNCSHMGIAKSGNIQCERDENIMWWFAEALPVMWIHCFPPFNGVKIYEVTHIDGSFSDNAPTDKELSSSVAGHLHCGSHQQDLFQNADVGFVREMNDNYKLTEDKLNSSLTDLKTEISQAEDTCTYSTVTAENVPGIFFSHGGKQRKRSRLCWKKGKKLKTNLMDSNIQTQHLRLYDTGNISNSKSYAIVPGSPCAIWNKSEEDLFLLGLYIFGKNFNAVKRFVETKKMEDILAYYYGMFFRTEAYCRWTESRKTRSRKRIQGRRIFSDWRQQELLMRLLPHIPENSKHEVSEITRTFNEGKISLEEFVTMLKALAGPDVLFQAVGIGKGKEDLTSALIEPEKTNQGLSRNEIPVGRACSSLSTEDIVQFLTGDFRLSKARANDLFWEAVWPLLLARGWHSEQPEDQVPFGMRQSLVFLIPGVHKFSRRNLTKGIHYFGSLSEVLSRVASDPRLLELDSDEARSVEGKPELLWASENAEVENGDARHSHCYLQPRTCKSNSDSLIFTVVDTSLISQGDQSRRMRKRVAMPSDDDSKNLETASLETEDKNSLPSQLTEQQCCKDSTNEDLFNNSAEECTDIAINLAGNISCLGSHKASNPDENNVLLSPMKQRRLGTYNDCKDDTVDSCLIETGGSQVQKAMLNLYSNEETSIASLGINSLGKSIPLMSLSEDNNYERSINTSIISGDSSFANNISTTAQNSRECRMISEMGLSSKWLQDQTESTVMNSVLVTGSELMNDLKSEEISIHESSSEFSSEDPNKKSGVIQTCVHDLQEKHSGGSQQNNSSVLLENESTARRQSTRVRPLTARALDAFASGYFTPKRRKKGGNKTSSSDGYRTKSLSSLVHDQISSSFNACSSDC